MFRFTRGQQKCCAVHLTAAGLAIAIATKAPKQPARIEKLHFIPHSDEQDELETSLRNFVKQELILNAPTILVLPGSDYELLRVEKLAVNKKEQQQAIIWNIQQRISIAIEDALIETFTEPNISTPDKPTHLFTAVSPKKSMLTTIRLLKRCGLRVTQATIFELALLSLLASNDQSEHVACIALSPTTSRFLSAFRYQLTASHVVPLPEMTPENLSKAALQPLFNELNRLISYQKQHVEYFKLFCTPTTPHFDQLLPLLQENLDMPLEVVSLEPLLAQSSIALDETMVETFPALCGVFCDE